MRKALHHALDDEAESEVDDSRRKRRVGSSQQRGQSIDAAGPAVDDELGVEIPVGLQSMDEAEIPQARGLSFCEQLDERTKQR